MVVGSGRGDAPKYAGEGVVSGGHPGVPGCSCLSFSGILIGYFGLVHVGRAASDAHHLSLRCCIVSDAVMSRCHMCMGHMTFGYKAHKEPGSRLFLL